LKYRTGYRVFTNASEIRQVYDWQTDLGTESLTFRAEKHLWRFTKQELQTENPWRNRPTAMWQFRRGKRNFNFFGQLNYWDNFDRERFMTYPKTPLRITWLEPPAWVWKPYSNRPNRGNEILEITIWLKIAGLANISSDLRLYMSFRVSNRTHNLSTNHESICCWEGMNSVRPWLTVNDYHRFGDDVLRMKRRNLEPFGRYHERSSWRANRRFETSIIAAFDTWLVRKHELSFCSSKPFRRLLCNSNRPFADEIERFRWLMSTPGARPNHRKSPFCILWINQVSRILLKYKKQKTSWACDQ